MPLLPKDKTSSSAFTMRSRIGLIALKDKDGDNHTIPVTYISRLTDWQCEWGPDVCAFVIGDDTDSKYPKYIMVDMPLAAAEQEFMNAANGAFVDLRKLSGKPVMAKIVRFQELSEEQRHRVIYGSQLSKAVSESAAQDEEKAKSEKPQRRKKAAASKASFEPLL